MRIELTKEDGTMLAEKVSISDTEEAVIAIGTTADRVGVPSMILDPGTYKVVVTRD